MWRREEAAWRNQWEAERQDLLNHKEGWKGKVMIIWYSFHGPHHRTHTLAHRLCLPFPSFQPLSFVPQGSHCKFLPRHIIALLASPCNGPVLSNPEHWDWALPETKDYSIDSSLFPVPLLYLPISFLHFFLTSSNFLTVTLCCLLPPGSHDLMRWKAGPLWVIRSHSVVDAPLFFPAWWLCSIH